ncbi:hypothetical protein TNCV_1859401 [Trichonephila clavipes]|nr:hypothetical protein TNCV_1859401 [Trichonephila clavipes]
MCFLNQWVQKSCGRSQQEPSGQGSGEYFPPLQFHASIVEVKIDGITIYRVEVQPVSGSGKTFITLLGEGHDNNTSSRARTPCCGRE